ncbi:unnamed protein product [Medioppia subpectinata]|uniref:Cytochrome P450 n=1 Tax=Medioppia subpectinata TaxID=1979941 RepID=A0A7R9QCT5_9ACAR|nr:unnamed protein product [Medioppia subpectinata]CAG2118552.1 unnamed protein product [Medioppia subpectinata]
MVSEPVLIKQILVKEFYKFRNRPKPVDRPHDSGEILFDARDDHWKRIRAIASPAFTSGKLRRMYPLIDECCRDFLAALDRDVVSATSGHLEVDIKRVMSAFTMDVIASTSFATKTNTYSDPNNPFITTVKGIIDKNRWQILLDTVLPTFMTQNPVYKPRTSDGTSGFAFIIDVSRRLISERKKSGHKRHDLLQLLIDAEKEADNSSSNETVKSGPKSTATTDAVDTGGHHVNKGVDELMAEKQALSGVAAKRLTEAEIVAQCLLFFIVGYETTATTLSYCTYELALNPDIQDMLVAETAEAVDEDTGDIDYETLCRLPYLDAVISETLRHYPTSLRLEREAMDEVVLSTGGSDLKCDKGVVVNIPVYAIHHDPDHYPDPFAFKPDRFLAHNRHHIKPYTYLPFGAGPRNCIAIRFALLEAKLAMVKLVNQFRFYRVPDTDVPATFYPGRNVITAQRLILGVEKR